MSGAKKDVGITLFRKAGEVAGTRRGISEIVKWVNYVTGNRFLTIAADLSESINLEHGSIWGHYDPETNPLGTRLKAAIQEAGNVSTAIGLVSQSASLDPEKFAGVWAISGTYGAFTPLMYTPARVWSQQNQDSKFRMGVLHILVGHSGPETAADGAHALRHLRAAGVEAVPARPDDSSEFLGLQRRRARRISRPPRSRPASRRSGSSRSRWRARISRWRIAPRSRTRICRAAAKGFYVIRDFAPGKPRHGYVITQGSSSTVNLVSVLPKLEAAGVNVRVIAAISEELFDRQPEAYRNAVLPPEARYDLMVVSHGHAPHVAAARTSVRSPTSTR